MTFFQIKIKEFNPIIYIRTAGHLLLEHLDHVVVVAGAGDLAQEAVQLALGHEDTHVVEGAAEVVFVDGAILVDVHQLEAVLVHVQLVLGETSLILTPKQFSMLHLILSLIFLNFSLNFQCYFSSYLLFFS